MPWLLAFFPVHAEREFIVLRGLEAGGSNYGSSKVGLSPATRVWRSLRRHRSAS